MWNTRSRYNQILYDSSQLLSSSRTSALQVLQTPQDDQEYQDDQDNQDDKVDKDNQIEVQKYILEE